MSAAPEFFRAPFVKTDGCRIPDHARYPCVCEQAIRAAASVQGPAFSDETDRRYGTLTPRGGQLLLRAARWNGQVASVAAVTAVALSREAPTLAGQSGAMEKRAREIWAKEIGGA